MLIDPALYGLLEPRAQLNSCTLGILAQAGSETDLANGGQHFVHLTCSRGLFWDVVHVDAGYWDAGNNWERS